MKNITDIFFDLDHTLWDFDKNSELAFNKIFSASFPSLNAKKFIEIYAPINQECWKLYQVDEITHQELRYNRFKLTFDAMNIEISDEEIDKISDDYIAFLPDNSILFDGALEILDYLFTKYNLHIITNGFAEVQFKKMKSSAIEHYFKTVTNSEIANAKKPNPKIFEFALNIANAEKANSIMIGDSLEADIYGALEFGIDAIYFNPEKNKVPLELKNIIHFNELKSIL